MTDMARLCGLILESIADYDRDIHASSLELAAVTSSALAPRDDLGPQPRCRRGPRNTPRDWRGRRPPSLAFEVVSEGSEAHERDYVTKRAEYLAYGLCEYWIVDPQTKCVTVLIRDGDAWVEQVYRDDQQARAWSLPGLRSVLRTCGSTTHDDEPYPIP